MTDDARFICTKDNPWTPDKGRAAHPDAIAGEQRDGYPAGDTVDYRCPHCLKEFSVELPQ